MPDFSPEGWIWYCGKRDGIAAGANLVLLMECGNDSYRFDCFCSCSKPRLVQSRLVRERKLDLLALQDEQKQLKR